MARVIMREERLLELCQQRGLVRPAAINQTALAQAVGVEKSYLSRLLRGNAGAGSAIISGALAYFGVGFDDLFEVTSRSDLDAAIDAEPIAS